MKKKVLSIIALLGFSVLGFLFLKGRTHELAKVLEVDLRYVFVLLLLTALSSLLNGHKLKMLIQTYGVNLKFGEWWGIQMMTLFWNDLTPFKGGLSARAVYLKKKYSLSYTRSVSITGIAYLTDFLVFGAAGVILSLFLPVAYEVKYLVLTLFLTVFLGSVFVMFFVPLPIKLNIKLLRHIANSINEIKSTRTNYQLIAKLGINCMLRWLTGALKLYFAFLALGSIVSIYTCLMIDLFIGIAMIISITPMNLGFRESVVVISSKLFGTGTVVGALVAALDRAVGLIWVFVLTPFFGSIMFHDFKYFKKNPEKEVLNKKGGS